MDNAQALLKSAVYLALYDSFAQPRATLGSMFLVTLGTVYVCTGAAYLLALTLEPASAQLAAAVLALTNTLIASTRSRSVGLERLTYNLSFARWALEGYVVRRCRFTSA